MSATVRVEIIGLDELERALPRAIERLEVDLRAGVLDAARQGVEAAQREHPYTDRTYHLTGDSHAEQAVDDGRNFEASMEWPAPYAGFVDKGTSRSRPYPFTPRAEEVAEAALDKNVEQATARFSL